MTMSEEFKLRKLFKSVRMTLIIHQSSYWRNSDQEFGLLGVLLRTYVGPPQLESLYSVSSCHLFDSEKLELAIKANCFQSLAWLRC